MYSGWEVKHIYYISNSPWHMIVFQIHRNEKWISASTLRRRREAPIDAENKSQPWSKSLLNWEKERSWPFVLWGQEDTSKRRLSNWELLSNWEHFEYCYKSLIFLRQTHKFVWDSGSHLQGKKKTTPVETISLRE